MTDAYKRYLKSPNWFALRRRIIEERKVCKHCGTNKHLQVHHLHYRNIYREKDEDLMLLCTSCHDHVHKKISKNKMKKGLLNIPFRFKRKRIY